MRITQRINRERFEPTMQRQDELCLFCKGPFTEQLLPEWDHLDNNLDNSRPENIALVHRTCNNKKKFNPEYQVIAHDAKEEYEKAVLVCERMLADTGTTEQLTSSQAINKTNKPLCLMKLNEYTLHGNYVKEEDYVNAMDNLCFEMNGTGSQAAIKRYVNSFCNPLNGKFTLSKNEKDETIIRRRTEN